jgi:hypothetical protein
MEPMILDRASALFEAMSTAQTLGDFLTLAAYAQLDAH